jgi:hypothetical protein
MTLAPRQHSFAAARALMPFFLKGPNAQVARKADWRFIQPVTLRVCADQIDLVLDSRLVVHDTPAPATSARASQGFRAEAIASQLK